ncbi:Fur family transcriptional regulator [Nocardia sp. alder85J]|uniref:Fur family transcriptional regulator n=1 Tax=Nocardia sp. alder85J TaxID=2862949 RepID=UPI001CD2D3C8|nr:Fur family transcriptional regulator [Nocardia sp. alder85J]MCX4094327.1 Fur family transcriptional regulator [Nocardia sp. alder85J]
MTGGDHLHATLDPRHVLRDHGLRCTTPRLAVLTALGGAREQGHLTVAQIQQLLSGTGHQVDTATVYRTVATLVEANVLHALVVDERITSYGLTDTPHHHAVCTRCGAIDEVPAEQLRTALAAARSGSRFALPETGGLTLHGLCPSCQQIRESARHRR